MTTASTSNFATSFFGVLYRSEFACDWPVVTSTRYILPWAITTMSTPCGDMFRKTSNRRRIRSHATSSSWIAPTVPHASDGFVWFVPGTSVLGRHVREQNRCPDHRLHENAEAHRSHVRVTSSATVFAPGLETPPCLSVYDFSLQTREQNRWLSVRFMKRFPQSSHAHSDRCARGRNARAGVPAGIPGSAGGCGRQGEAVTLPVRSPQRERARHAVGAVAPRLPGSARTPSDQRRRPSRPPRGG